MSSEWDDLVADYDARLAAEQTQPPAEPINWPDRIINGCLALVAAAVLLAVGIALVAP